MYKSRVSKQGSRSLEMMSRRNGESTWPRWSRHRNVELPVRGERGVHAARVVRIFTRFARTCIREVGRRGLSTLLCTLGVESVFAETISTLAADDLYRGRRDLDNAMTFIIIACLQTADNLITHYSVDDRGVIFLSDDDSE